MQNALCNTLNYTKKYKRNNLKIYALIYLV